ncbi:MAG: TIM barrel protein [Deltaproteobacteria bacterium]
MEIGIMQGRLSNKPGKPLQSFPLDTWTDEFTRARSLGFDCIEWLIDGNMDEFNPITTSSGREQIKFVSKNSGIKVESLCAHCFIDGNLIEYHEGASHSYSKLMNIIDWGNEIGIKTIIIPLMEGMSLSDEKKRSRLIELMRSLELGNNLKLALESDMPGKELGMLISEINRSQIGVLYDIGNANALGLNIEKDIHELSSQILEVHLKDRSSIDGVSKRLGECDTPFENAFHALKKIKWEGLFVLETPIFENWEIEAKCNIRFSQNLISILQ